MKGYTNGKRWLALFLSLALILTMLPLGALRVFAESGDEEIYREICMYDDDHFCMLYESKPGSSSSGSPFLDGVSYDKDTNTVHLDNVDTAGSDVSLSCVNMGEDFRIDVSGDNFLNAIWCDGMEGVNCSLTIDGSGSLMLYHGIVVNGSKSSETTLTIGDSVWFSVGEGGIFVEHSLAEYDGLTIEGQLAEGAVVKEMAQKQPYSETITNDSGYLHLDIYRSVDPGDTTWYGCFHIFSSGSPTGQYFNMYRLTGEPGSFTDYERINSESYTVEAEMLLSYMPYTEEPDSWNYYIGADGEELDSVDIFPTGAEVLRRPRITTNQLPDGTVGEEYFFQLEAKANSGGEIRGFNPYDSMPAGLKIDQDNGQIYGTPEKAGIYTLRFVTNEYKEPSLIQSHPKTLQLIVNNPSLDIVAGTDFQQYGNWSLKVTKAGADKPAVERYVRYGDLFEGDELYTGRLASGKYTAELSVSCVSGYFTYSETFDVYARNDEPFRITAANVSFVPAKACGAVKITNFTDLPQPQVYTLNAVTSDAEGQVLATQSVAAYEGVVGLKSILPDGAATCEITLSFTDAQYNSVELAKQTFTADEIAGSAVELYADTWLVRNYGPYKLQVSPAEINGCVGLSYNSRYLNAQADAADTLYFYLAPEVFEDGGDALFTARITRWPENLLDTWDLNRWDGPTVDLYEKTFLVSFERLTKDNAVFGTVTDGTDPIPYATVTATQSVNNRSFSMSTVTGANGSYRINALANVPTDIAIIAEGFREKQSSSVALNAANNFILQPAGRIAVTIEGGSAEEVRFEWGPDTDTAQYNSNKGSGSSFVLIVPGDGVYSVRAHSDDFCRWVDGTVTVTDGYGTLTLRPTFRATIDWSGSDTGNDDIFVQKEGDSTLSGPFYRGYKDSDKVDPGTYIVTVRNSEKEVLASQTVTVAAGETAYVELSVEGEDRGVSGGIEAPRRAAYGEVYKIYGNIEDVTGELLGIFIGGPNEGVIVNGRRVDSSTGYIVKAGTPYDHDDKNADLDCSLPFRFTIYCTQRAESAYATQGLNIYALVRTKSGGEEVCKMLWLGNAVTAYAPSLSFSVSPAVPTIEREEDGQTIQLPGAVSFYGTAPTGSAVYLYDNGDLAAVLTSTGTGKFEGKVQLRSSMMGHTLRAELHDADGNAIASAEGSVTFTAGGPVPTDLKILGPYGGTTSLNLNGKPVSRAARDGNTRFTATFENADRLKEFTMKTSEGTWEGKVFFQVTTPSETVILPSESTDGGTTWISQAHSFTSDNQPTGVHLLYQAESANEPYVATIEAGEGETEDIEIDAGYLVKLENEMTMDDWRAYFYNIEDGYDEWVAGGGTFNGGFENEDTGSLMAANDDDMYAYIAGILDKTAEMDAQEEAGTDEPVPDRHERFGTVMASTAGEITSKKDEYTYITYADKPKWDTGTEQNVNLRLKQLKLQGYTCSETTDDNGNVVLAFHKLFYYDNLHNPANRELYDGDPSDWKSKATGSTLDVTYLYVKVKSGGTKGGVWMRQQTAILTPGAMSPIHTLPNDMPSTYQGPRSYRDASELQGELLWSEPGSDYSIDINKYKNAGFWFTTGKNRISTQHWGQITLSVSTFGLNKYVQALEKIPGATTTLLKKGGESLLSLEAFSVANVSKITGELWDSLFDTKTFGYDDYDQMFNNYLQNLNYWKDVKKFMEENNNPEYFKEINNFDIELGMVDDIINDNIHMLSKISSMGRLKQAGNIVNNFTNDNANGLGKFSFAVGFVPEYGPEASLATDCNIFGQNALNDNIQADIGEVTGNFITDLSGFMERDKRMKEYIVMNNIQRRNIEGKDFVELTKMPEWMGNDPLRPKDAVIVPNHDPSGIVYEAVLSNPVEGATVTLYKYEEAAGDMVLWDDSDGLGQENPVVTDADGFYRWDVPEGEWFVRAVAVGYADGSSQNDVEAADPAHEHGGVKYLPVLPPQLNVNIPLVDDSEPVVASTEVSTDGVIITFSKYMEEAGLTAANFTLNGAPIEPEKLDSEQAPDNIVYEGEAPSYTRTVRLAGTFEPGETISVTISNALKSYAGTAFAGYANDRLTVPEPAPAGLTYVTETKNARAVKSSKFVTITTDEVSEEAPVLIASYGADGRFLGLVVVTEPGGSGESEGGAAEVKLFWIDEALAPKEEEIEVSD